MATIHRIIRGPYVWLRTVTTDLLFERRLGVQTTGDVGLADLGLAAEGRMNYQPIGWLKLRRVLPRRSVSPNEVFLDIGCGKGRAVLLAATYPFRRVIGIELSSQLVEIAQNNVNQCQDRLRCKDIVVTQADAVEYQIPDDVTVICMNNPLQGEDFRSVTTNVLESYDRQPRTMRIAYANPIEERALLATGRIRLIRKARGYRPGRDWSRSNSIKLYQVEPR